MIIKNILMPGYPEFGVHLNQTGRPMIYSCSWPVYQIYAGIKVSKILSYLLIILLSMKIIQKLELK